MQYCWDCSRSAHGRVAPQITCNDSDEMIALNGECIGETNLEWKDIQAKVDPRYKICSKAYLSEVQTRRISQLQIVQKFEQIDRDVGDIVKP